MTGGRAWKHSPSRRPITMLTIWEVSWESFICVSSLSVGLHTDESQDPAQTCAWKKVQRKYRTVWRPTQESCSMCEEILEMYKRYKTTQEANRLSKKHRETYWINDAMIGPAFSVLRVDFMSSCELVNSMSSYRSFGDSWELWARCCWCSTRQIVDLKAWMSQDVTPWQRTLRVGLVHEEKMISQDVRGDQEEVLK